MQPKRSACSADTTKSHRPKHRRGATSDPPPPVDLSAYDLAVVWVAWAGKARDAAHISYAAYGLVLWLAGQMTPGQPFVASYKAIEAGAHIKHDALAEALTALEAAGLLVRITRRGLEPWPEGGPGAQRWVQRCNAYLPVLPDPDDVYEPRRAHCESGFPTGNQEKKDKEEEAVTTVDNSPESDPMPDLLVKYGWDRPEADPLGARIAAEAARRAAEWARRHPDG